MLELGRWAESCIATWAAMPREHGVDVLVGVQRREPMDGRRSASSRIATDAAFFFEDPESAGEFSARIRAAGDAILFKGSRGTHVETSARKMEE